MMKNRTSTFLLILVLFALISCSKSNRDEKFLVEFNKVGSIGKENGNENEIVGLMGGISVDDSGNVYVSDNAFRKVKKFSPSGEYLATFGKGEGKGPGEFLDMRGVDIDSQGNVYVADMNKREITMFDRLGNVQLTIKPGFSPTKVVAFSPASVFAVGFKDTYDGNIVHRYDTKQGSLDKPVVTFCDRYTGPNQWEIERVGEPDVICKGANGSVYCSWYYPYRIRMYDAAGEQKDEYSRSVPFYKPPYLKDKTTTYVMPQSGSKGVAVLNDTTLVNLIYEFDEPAKELRYFFDLWDIRNHKFLGMYDARQMGSEFIPLLAADGKGFLYLGANKPYPHVFKVKVTISKQD